MERAGAVEELEVEGRGSLAVDLGVGRRHDCDLGGCDQAWEEGPNL